MPIPLIIFGVHRRQRGSKKENLGPVINPEQQTQQGGTTEMDSLAEIIRYLLIFVAAMFAMLIVLVLIISLLPQSNPLKRILTALSYRIAATFLLGAVAVPVEFIPGVDVAYDVAAPAFLLWFWYTLFRDAGWSNTTRKTTQRPTIIDVTPKRK